MFLVIGYGNPLCSDDGVSWHVIDALDRILPEAPTVKVHQLTPEWAEPVSQADFIIFVDASVDGMPGEIRCHLVEPVAGNPGSHEATPGGILGMAVDLFGACPPARLVCITGGSFEISDQLTPVVEAAVPGAVALIMTLIREFKAS